MRNRNLKPSNSALDALALSHGDFTVSEVYCEVHMKRVRFIFFRCPTLVKKRKTSFSISLPGSKFTISLIHLKT